MKIETKSIPEVFYLYCALNYNGYNKENNKKGMHPVREFIRKKLHGKKFPKYNFKYHSYQYTKQILTTKNLQPTPQTNPDFIESIAYLRKFSKEAILKELWETTGEKTWEEIKAYKTPIQQIKDLLEQSFTFEPRAKTVTFTVNLLESYWRGFSIAIGDDAYIITGPSDKPNIRNVLHEFIHLYLEDFHPSSTKELSEKIKLLPQSSRENYREGETIMRESLIRALVVYLSQKSTKIKTEIFSRSDKSLQLPLLFLEALDKESPERLSQGVLKKIGEFPFEKAHPDVTLD